MKKNLIQKIKCLLCGVLLLVPLFPYHIFAETVGGSSPIIGVNITYVGYDGEVVPYQTTVHFDTEQTMWRCKSSHSTMGCQVWESENINGSTLDEITGTITTNATSTYTYRLYQYEFIFDKTYVGSITFNGNHPGATTTTTYYVNGDRLVLTDINLVTSFTIGSYNLTYAPLETIEQLRQYNYPIESFTFIYKFLMSSDATLTDAINYYNYSYPLFNVIANSDLLKSQWSTGQSYYDQVLIFGVNRNINNLTRLEDYFRLYNITVKDFSFIYRNDTYPFTIVKILYNITSSNSGYNGYFYPKENMMIMPIFNEYYSYNFKLHISTDFALVYGLQNELLENLDIIANGTSASTSSSSDLEDSADDIIQNSSTMFNFENQQNQNMNNALQNINTNYDIGSFGSSFLASANWVRTQFDNITSSTPFGSVLSFSLLLGLALLIIGKVYK